MGFDRRMLGGAAAAKVAGLGVAALLATSIAVAPGQAWAADGEPEQDVATTAEIATGEGTSIAADKGGAIEASGGNADEPGAVESDANVRVGAPSQDGNATGTLDDAAKVDSKTLDGKASSPQSGDVDANEATSEGKSEPSEANGGPSDSVTPSATLSAADAAEPKAGVASPQIASASSQQKREPKSSDSSVVVSATAAASAPEPQADENVYRMYNPNSGEHFYTASIDEATHLFNVGWRWESVAYKAASKSGAAVYRLYNPNAGNHFYTLSKGESDYLRQVGWRYENIAWYSVGSTVLYRLYNPNSTIGEHLYTTSSAERDSVIRAGWRDEGTAWNVVSGAFKISPRWVVSPAYGSQERYWIQADGNLAKGRYIQPTEGTGYSVAAYARPSGAVVRGAWYDGGSHVYLADNDGRLANQSEGWLITKAYDGHDLQRYYMDGLGRAKTGEFSVSGRNYLGRTDTGYVVRGTYFLGDTRYIADNDGVIQSKKSRKQIYVDWAKSIAADNRHGYSQINRWGPDYDCSALVISALRQAGYQTGAANSTRDMRRELTRYGWQVVSPNPSNLQYGDILLHDGVHTAIWCGNGQLVEAWVDENGSWQGYRSGDQTGQEIRVRSYYNDGWLCYLRHA